MNESMEKQMSLLLINSIFDTAALWFIYLMIHFLKSVPLPSQLQDKVFVFFSIILIVIALFIVVIQEPQILQTLKITSRIFLMSKYGGVLLAELLIVVFKSYIMPTAGLLNIFLSDGIYMVFVIINVNMIFDFREKSQWYFYRYEIEGAKETEFQNEADAKTYYELSDDYSWAFNVMSLIIVFVTVIMFFIII